MTTPSPLVGVVVLNYNGWRMTLDCLRSLAKADFPRLRVVVVDNRSTDDSVVRIHEAMPDVELVVNGSNAGFAAGNNVGVRLLMERGAEYIWLLNNDATADPGALAAMVVCAEADPRIGEVGAAVYHAHAPTTMQSFGGGPVSLWTGHTRLADRPGARVDYITGACVLLRSRALREVGLLDERYFFQWEDVDLGFRMRKRGWLVAVAGDAKVWHEGGGSDPGLSPFRVRHHAMGMVMFLRSHAPLPWVGAWPMFAYYVAVAVRQRSLATLRAAVGGWWSGWWK
ncbi:MAG: glycosyltransferase family 2 protein [Planctomycetota bacterium]|nr:glycosyltransferase family 2 protein [Planctomycetota bacterium]